MALRASDSNSLITLPPPLPVYCSLVAMRYVPSTTIMLRACDKKTESTEPFKLRKTIIVVVTFKQLAMKTSNWVNPTYYSRTLLPRIDVSRPINNEANTLVTIRSKPISRWLLVTITSLNKSIASNSLHDSWIISPPQMWRSKKIRGFITASPTKKLEKARQDWPLFPIPVIERSIPLSHVWEGKRQFPRIRSCWRQSGYISAPHYRENAKTDNKWPSCGL